jgi:hypothetical protein
VLSAGDHVPEASVWLAPREQRTCAELAAEHHALFVFFLFAWSST